METTYISSVEFCRKHNVNEPWLRSHLRAGAIPGARFILGRWHIPADAECPARIRPRLMEAPAGFWTIHETAHRWGCSAERVRQLCIRGCLPGAEHTHAGWMVPAGMDKPADRRRGSRHGE